MKQNRTFLAGLLPEKLQEIIAFEKSYQAGQLFLGILQGSKSIDEISTLSMALRSELSERFGLFSVTIEQITEDADGTRKMLLRLWDNQHIECVLLRDEEGRKTACLSTQAGCAMGCAFCRTATMGLRRNLSGQEIIELFLLLQNEFGKISNIVFMGMGEPLQNLAALRESITFFSFPKGLNIGLRRITISTCGLVRPLRDLLENGPAAGIALSLTAADEELRTRLMPVSRQNPLVELKPLFLAYQRSGGRRITLEYVLLKGVNDTDRDILALRKFCNGLNYIINLIPWNPAAELDFESPGEADINAFCERTAAYSLNISRRYRRGRGISGACGQLAVKADSD
ncbi:MAG: 23S rRNA (adenine(2503)-C(2))-methyltransferase RlmN [Spirochaetales bacterium]|nr:23S rRNA (adenine(2503)-C(2))-methyltransferase RlmN [Spirochaetales bacterium]